MASSFLKTIIIFIFLFTIFSAILIKFNPFLNFILISFLILFILQSKKNIKEIHISKKAIFSMCILFLISLIVFKKFFSIPLTEFIFLLFIFISIFIFLNKSVKKNSLLELLCYFLGTSMLLIAWIKFKFIKEYFNPLLFYFFILNIFLFFSFALFITKND